MNIDELKKMIEDDDEQKKILVSDESEFNGKV